MRYRSSVLQPEEWTLDVDLVSDMQKMLSERLTKAGYQNVDPNRVMYQYFNAQKRIVEPKPRTVHRSREFVCPKPYEQALANFEAKVERGDSLVPYLSDKLMDASYSDGMLNDWNIYHFHLTNRFKDNGWAKRSDYELFAYVTDTDLYLIQVYAHRDPLLYWKKEILRIVYENWPQLLEPFHLKDVHSLVEKFGDEQYKEVREAHLTTFVELDEDLVFAMIGGGYMSDGSCGEAMRASDFWHNRLQIIEQAIVGDMKLLCGIIGQVSDRMERREEIERVKNEYRIRLLWIESEQKFTFCEQNHRVVLQLNLEEGFWRACRPMEVFGDLQSTQRLQTA